MHASSPTVAVDELPLLVRVRRGLDALRRLRENPDDTEMALRAALHLNAGALRRTLASFESDAEGRELLARRPALDATSVDLDALHAFPDGTLGHAYGHFMRSRGLGLEVFVPPREIRDERTRYIGQRLRQTHDLWHVVTGYDTDVRGEIELQAFSFGQLRTPFAFFVALGGIAKAGPARPALLRRVVRAYLRGLRARPLSYRVWESRLAQPLAEVRAELRLT